MRKLDAGSKNTDIILEPKDRIILVRLSEADGRNASSVISGLVRKEAAIRGLGNTTVSMVESLVEMFEPVTAKGKAQ
jgi:hypothetical protein